MKLLIVAATKEEIQPFLDWSTTNKIAVEILITGVGMVATAFTIGKKLGETPFDILLNVGIAGIFSTAHPVGSIVRVHDDCFAELGAEDDEVFLSLNDLKLGNIHFTENPGTVTELNIVSQLPVVNAITVNRVHGNKNTIDKTRNRFSPDIESMEGASVFYAAKQIGIFSLQVRSISNVIEKRNKNNWDIPLAIRNLNNWLIEFVKQFLYKIKDET